jgi:heptosyltransferase-2
MSRVLLLKFGAIGDVIMTIPAAYQLHLQGHQVDWACGTTVFPILQLYPWINPIPVDDRAILVGTLRERMRAIFSLWRTLWKIDRGGRYDLIATLYYDPRYRILTLPLRAGRKIRLSHSVRNFRLLPGRRHTDEFARILLGLPDAVMPTSLPPIHPPNLPPSPIPASGRTRIVLAPAGARNMLAQAILRRWPVEHYVALTRLLLERIPGVDIVLIGGPDDTWAHGHFAEFPVRDLIGAISLTQTIALLDTTDVFVSHDTGPLHLGGQAGCGIVAIFGPTDPRSFLPRRPGTVAIWGGEGFACRPCYDAHDFPQCPANECMTQVTPEEVLGEVIRMLLEREAGIIHPPRIVTPESTVPQTRLIMPTVAV